MSVWTGDKTTKRKTVSFAGNGFKTTVSITPGAFTMIEKLAEAEGVTPTEVLRNAVVQALEANGFEFTLNDVDKYKDLMGCSRTAAIESMLWIYVGKTGATLRQ